MTIDATQKILDFLNKYCDRTVSTGCDYYRLTLGGISADYTLHVDGDDAWVEGSEEDLAILQQQSGDTMSEIKDYSIHPKFDAPFVDLDTFLTALEAHPECALVRAELVALHEDWYATAELDVHDGGDAKDFDVEYWAQCQSYTLVELEDILNQDIEDLATAQDLVGGVIAYHDNGPTLVLNIDEIQNMESH